MPTTTADPGRPPCSKYAFALLYMLPGAAGAVVGRWLGRHQREQLQNPGRPAPGPGGGHRPQDVRVATLPV